MNNWNMHLARKYVEAETQCPFCDNQVKADGEFDSDVSGILQPVRCPGCKTKWSDIYRLVGVHDGISEWIPDEDNPLQVFVTAEEQVEAAETLRVLLHQTDELIGLENLADVMDIHVEALYEMRNRLDKVMLSQEEASGDQEN